MPLEGLRALPPCPNLDNKILHPVFDEVDAHHRFANFDNINGGWREKAFWTLWEANPIAYPVTHVGAYGEMVTEADDAELERMSDTSADMEFAGIVSLKFQTADNQDILTCSVCREQFTCDQDMGLHSLGQVTDRDVKWVFE